MNSQTLNIKGNTTDEQQIIDVINYKKAHENIKSIVDELNFLQKQFFTIGYFDASYSELAKTNDTTYQTTFRLNTKYTSLRISYNKDKMNESLLGAFSMNYTATYFDITPENLTPFLEALVENFQNTGNPFAEVQLKNIKKEDQIVLADLDIQVINKKRRLDKIVIKGYEKFPKSYTQHYLRLTSKVFNKEEITKQTKRIDQLPFARQIKDPEILFTKDSTTLYIYIEKVKSNFFDGFIGFNSDENTGNLKLNGYLDLKLTNNLNAGEQFTILWKNDGNGQTRFLADLKIPYIINSPLGINAALDIFKRDSLFTTVNTTFKTFYQINQNNQVYLGIQQTESNNLLDNSANTAIDDYKSFFTTAGYTFAKRNNNYSIFQEKTTLSIEGQLGTRKNNAEKNEQTKFSFTGNYLWELNNRNFIYINNTSEALISEAYLTNEKLRLGGIQSIRGFNENSLEATLYSTINTEYRYILSRNSYVHSIIDFTYLQDDLTQTDVKLYGFGFGLGIRSKSGLLKINYAVGKTDNSAIKLSESKVHISLSTSF